MATMGTETGVVFRPAGEAPASWSMGMLFERLLGAAESDGAMGVALITQAPGSATPLHVHSRESEAFLLLEGSMTYRAGEEVYRLGPGGFIYLPSRLPHAFRITGASPTRFLALATPATILSLYEEIGVPAQERRLPGAPPSAEDVGRWIEAAGRHGIEVVGPPLPEEG
jgi:quercetin dioxygenase-like cupin family protein